MALRPLGLENKLAVLQRQPHRQFKIIRHFLCYIYCVNTLLHLIVIWICLALLWLLLLPLGEWLASIIWGPLLLVFLSVFVAYIVCWPILHLLFPD